jgi:hypothetical protein
MPSPGYGVGVDDEGNDVIQPASGLPEEAPFQVGEEIEVGDLSDVQQDILPVSKDVHVRIRKASVAVSASKELKSLKLELELPDGILIENRETGEYEAKYIGKVAFPGFMDLCFWAAPTAKPYFREPGRKWALEFKNLMKALDEDITQIKINDAFFERISNRDVLVSIRHESESEKGPDGKRVKTGTLREKFQGWKKYVGADE